MASNHPTDTIFIVGPRGLAEKNIHDITFKFCLTGSYGFYLSRQLRRASFAAFFDIGANQGLYSLMAAKNANILQIFSFEPNPQIIPYLADNIARNRAARIVYYPVGLGQKSEQLILCVNEGHSGGGTLFDGA